MTSVFIFGMRLAPAGATFPPTPTPTPSVCLPLETSFSDGVICSSKVEGKILFITNFIVFLQRISLDHHTLSCVAIVGFSVKLHHFYESFVFMQWKSTIYSKLPTKKINKTYQWTWLTRFWLQGKVCRLWDGHFCWKRGDGMQICCTECHCK